MLALCEYTAEERKVCMSKLHVCMRACVYARREEDPISTTLKVITLIKAVMCGDRGKEGRGEAGENLPSFMGQFRDCVIYRAHSTERKGVGTEGWRARWG